MITTGGVWTSQSQVEGSSQPQSCGLSNHREGHGSHSKEVIKNTGWMVTVVTEVVTEGVVIAARGGHDNNSWSDHQNHMFGVSLQQWRQGWSWQTQLGWP